MNLVLLVKKDRAISPLDWAFSPDSAFLLSNSSAYLSSICCLRRGPWIPNDLNPRIPECAGEDERDSMCCRSDHAVSFIPRSDSKELGGPWDGSRRHTPSRLSILEARFTLSDVHGLNNRRACPLHGERELPQHPSADLLTRPPRELIGTPSRHRHRSRSPVPYARPEWETCTASPLSATGVCNKIRGAGDAVRPPLGSPRYGWVEPGKGWTRCPSAGRSRQRSVQRCFRRSSHGNAWGPLQHLQQEGLRNPHDSKRPMVGVGDYNGCSVDGKGLGCLDTTEVVLGFDGHQGCNHGRVIPNGSSGDSGWATAYLAGEDEFLPKHGSHLTTRTWSTHAYADRRRNICEGVILASNRSRTRLVETHRMKQELGHARNHTQYLIKTNNALTRKVIALRKKVEWLGHTSVGMDPPFWGDQTDKNQHLQHVIASTACRQGMGQVRATSRQALPWRAPALSEKSTRSARAAWSECMVQRDHELQATAARRQGNYQDTPLVERIMRAHTPRARPRQEAHAITQTDADLLETADSRGAAESADSPTTYVNQNFRRCEQELRGLKPYDGASSASDRKASSSYAPRGQPIDPTVSPADRIPARASPEREGKSGNFSCKGEEQKRHGSLENGSRTREREPCLDHVSHPEETRPAATQMTSAAPKSSEAFHAEEARAIANDFTASPCLARDDTYVSRQRNQDGPIEHHEVTTNFTDAAVVSSEDATVGAPGELVPIFDVRVEKIVEGNAVDKQTIQQSVSGGRKGEVKALITRDTREHSTLDNGDTQSMSLIRERRVKENLFERSTMNLREDEVSGWTSPANKLCDKNSGTNPTGGGRSDTTLGSNLLCERHQAQDLRVDFHRTRGTLAAIKAASLLATTRSNGSSPGPKRCPAKRGGVALAFRRWRELALGTEGKTSTDESREAVRSPSVYGVRTPAEPVDSLNSDSSAREVNSRVHETRRHTSEEEVVSRSGHMTYQSCTGGLGDNDTISFEAAGGGSSRLSPSGIDVLSLSMAVSRAEAIEAVRCTVRRQQSQLLPSDTNASAGRFGGEPKCERNQAVSTPSGHLPQAEIFLCRRTEQAHTSERLKRTSRSKHGGSEDAGNFNEHSDEARTDPPSSDGNNTSRSGQPPRRRESTAVYTRGALTATCPIHAVGADAWEDESNGLLHRDQHGSGQVVPPLQRGAVNVLRHLPPNIAVTPPESVLSDHDTQNEASPAAVRATEYESATEGRQTANDRTGRQPDGSLEESAEAEVEAILRHSEDEDDTYRRECAVLAGTLKAVFALAALEYRRVSARFYRWKRARKHCHGGAKPTERFKDSGQGERPVGDLLKHPAPASDDTEFEPTRLREQQV